MTRYVETFQCPTCGTPASGRGHLCHPNTKSGPYTCEFCKKTVDDPRHVCPAMADKMEYACKECGRLAIYDTMLCAPVPVDED